MATDPIVRAGQCFQSALKVVLADPMFDSDLAGRSHQDNSR
jgi:hypothetical protein